MIPCHSFLGTMRRMLLTGILLVIALPLLAAEHSPTLDNRIAITPKGETISVILFLDQRLTMDDIYPVARSLPMTERRAYVVQSLQERFKEMSPRVMERLTLAQKEGSVTLVRPLWILNAIRVSLTTALIDELDASYSEVFYIANDAVYDDVLDIGWGVAEIGAPQVWNELGADGSGVIVGHKDSGVDWDHSGFDGHIWINPGEDLNGNGSIDEPEEVNGIDDDNNGYVDDFRGWNFDDNTNNVADQHGHGTKTASVISSHEVPPCDTVGVAPGAKLMILRGYWTQGAVFESSQYAILMGANVISASLSYKIDECGSVRDCPNYVAHRWTSEMELAAGIIHANSTGNEGTQHAIPYSVATPANCPPPAMTPSHEQQGGVSSIVGVSGYQQGGGYYTASGRGPSAWSQQDVCFSPRMPFCTPYPGEFEDYPYQGGALPGLIKPDITSPTNVASLGIGGGCSSISGTSGACPHVGGALALIYSAFPGITPEDAYLVLVNGAEDAGDAGFDSLWGFGKLRIFNSCSQSMDARAVVMGHVDDPLDNPVVGARVTTDGTQPVFTDQNGDYVLSLDPGMHTLQFEKWSYADTSAVINVAAGDTLVADAFMLPANAASLEGYVVHNGQPLAGQPVALPIADLTVLTDELGHYSLPDVFLGTHEFVVGTLPWQTDTLEATIEADIAQIDFTLERSPRAMATGPDSYGYYVYDNYDAEAAAFGWFEIEPEEGGPGTQLPFNSDNCTARNLPFAVRFYGQDYTTIGVCDNGLIIMGGGGTNEWSPYPIPRQEAPNNFVAPFYTDWIPAQGGSVSYYEDVANHRVIIEWYDVTGYIYENEVYVRATFQVILHESGFPDTPTDDSQIIFQYDLVEGRFDGVVGIENQAGTVGIQYEFQLFYDEHASPIEAGRALLITTDGSLETSPAPTMLPGEFSLEPNYPNPFNPTTTFAWTMPRAASIRLALYDVMGRESAVVYEGLSAAGRHEFVFDARDLPTGVYFARLEMAGKSLSVRKVLLLK